MADIRINALATTAASTASDDFVAVDGSANGTRKLNAFNPTFGGNLTVSGGTATVGASGGGNGSLVLKRSSDGLTVGNLSVDTTNSLLNLNTAYSFATISTEGVERLRVGTTTTTLAGNLTVSGTGLSSVAGNLNIGEPTGSGYRLYVKAGFGLAIGGSYIECGEYDKPCSILNHTNPAVSANLFQIQKQGTGVFTVSSTGNLLIGTTTDGGQKLQVSGNGLMTTGLTLGTSVVGGTGLLTLVRNSVISWNANSSTQDQYIYANGSSSLIFGTVNTTALTLDSSQNATFAGATTILGKSLNTESVSLQMGDGRTGNGYTWIDLVGDATYTDYGLRVVRGNAGANATSSLKHRGTGTFDITAEDAANVTIATSNTTRMTVKSDGKINFASLPTSSAGLSTGDIWNDGGTLKIV